MGERTEVSSSFLLDVEAAAIKEKNIGTGYFLFLAEDEKIKFWIVVEVKWVVLFLELLEMVLLYWALL
jgi:hypothetical protein